MSDGATLCVFFFSSDISDKALLVRTCLFGTTSVSGVDTRIQVYASFYVICFTSISKTSRIFITQLSSSSGTTYVIFFFFVGEISEKKWQNCNIEFPRIRRSTFGDLIVGRGRHVQNIDERARDTTINVTQNG